MNASYLWTSLIDPPHADRAEVALLGTGLRATGTQTCDDYTAAWTLDASQDWITRVLEVSVRSAAGDLPSWSRALRLTRDEETGRWTAECRVSGPQPEHLSSPGIGSDVELTDALDRAVDCDLGRCPLTNTMPIRREELLTRPGVRHSLIMAWVEMPSLRVIASDQYYEGVDATTVRYISGTREVDVRLTVDDDGGVLEYPDLAHREVLPETR